MYFVETKSLSHKFSNGAFGLKDINLLVPQGTIYGFLGPNGTGKTTTLKLLTGLLKKQKGEILIGGKELDKRRMDILKTVGTLIETPSLYLHLNAEQNLKILQKIYKCSNSRIADVLQLAGLQNAGEKKTRHFSLGMKQRLGIAIALLHNPSLLILDEPTNGLDPNGMIEIRELLKKINRELNCSMIVSSHLLAEMEKLATHVGIISNGSLLFQGTMEELTHKQNQTASVIMETNDNASAKSIIENKGITVSINGTGLQLSVTPKEEIANVIKNLVEQNIQVYHVSTTRNDLESIFMQMINN